MNNDDVKTTDANPVGPRGVASHDRRRLLLSLGAGAWMGNLIQPTDVFAMGAEKEKKISQTVSEHARAEDLPKEALKLPRWKPSRTGNFNLADARDNHFAFAKVQGNLAGVYSYLAQYGWILIAPPGKPAYPFLGRITLVRVFVTAADPSSAPDVGPDDYTMWGTFTTSHFDPRDFKPVSRVLNPYTGKMIEAPTTHYADRLVYRLRKSIIVPGVDPAFYDQPWDRDGGYSQHFINAGQDVTYTVLGSSQLDGPQQPRCDVGFWTVTRQDLMDPEKRSIDTQRNYSAIQKMSEYAWYGVEKGDPAQIFNHMTGVKTQDLARLPTIVKTAILERFPERFS